jgi:hypothetical protein
VRSNLAVTRESETTVGAGRWTSGDEKDPVTTTSLRDLCKFIDTKTPAIDGFQILLMFSPRDWSVSSFGQERATESGGAQPQRSSKDSSLSCTLPYVTVVC